jgi:hypothetical protein
VPVSLYIVEHLLVQLIVWKRAGVLAPRQGWRPSFVVYNKLHNLNPRFFARANCRAHAIERLCPSGCLDDDIWQEQNSRYITVGGLLCYFNIE